MKMESAFKSGFLLFFSVACFFAPAAYAQSVGSGSGTSSVFRTSNTQVSVKQLGILTVTAYVLIDGVRHDGLYITSVTPTLLGKLMKLAPGQILLSLDAGKTTSASAAEAILAARSGKPLSFQYAVIQGGRPFLLAGQVQDSAVASGSVSFSVSGKGAAPASSPGKQYTNAELESYCLQLINQSRQAEGARPVRYEPATAALASRYAEYMKSNASYYEPTGTKTPHIDLNGLNPGQRASAAGFKTQVLENIGRATRGPFVSDLTIVKDLHEMMMAEPKGQVNHRSTIVDPKCRYLGVGIARSGTRFYLVEEFSY